MPPRLPALGYRTALLCPRGSSRCRLAVGTTGHRSPFGPAPFGAFNPTTSYSVPVPRIGTRVLAGIPRSNVSLCIEATGSHVPYKSLIRIHAAFKPDAARAGLQDSAHADPGANTPSGFDIVHTLSARHRSVRFRSSLRISPDRIKSRLFCKRSPRLLFTIAACSGLEPALARRLRGAIPHLSYSTTPPSQLVCS